MNRFAEPGEFPPVLETVTMSKRQHEKLLAAEKDAARYRWLRDIGDSTWLPMGKRPGVKFTHQIDDAIDAAITKALEQP